MSQTNVYARGWVPHTCIAMASTVRIFSKNYKTNDFHQMGLVQSFKPTDTRKMERARGIGWGDRVEEIVPGTTDVSITVTRMALYTENIFEDFGYHTAWNTGGSAQGTVRTLAHMKNPFDINEVLVFHNFATSGAGPLSVSSDGTKFSEAGGTQYTSTWYHDCWISNYSKTMEITGNLICMEDVTIDVTWVSDGTEPAPYDPTDIWPTHGLTCGVSPGDVFDASTSAAAAPTGTMGMNSGTFPVTPATGIKSTTTDCPMPMSM